MAHRYLRGDGMSIVSRLKKSDETTTPPPSTPAGREDLLYWHRQLAEAVADVSEHESAVSRLQAAIAAGDAAEASSVGALLANRGKALERERTVDAEYQIAHGRIAAKALPRAEEELTTARAEVDRLRAEVVNAAKRELLKEAASVVGEYRRKLSEVHAVYDRLVGIHGALLGDAMMRPIEAPVFKLTPYAEVGIDIHGSVEPSGDPRRATLKATAAWQNALDRLVADPEAQIGDLIG